jgi:hypothetical protein
LMAIVPGGWRRGITAPQVRRIVSLAGDALASWRL